jgi:hypothetical protein
MSLWGQDAFEIHIYEYEPKHLGEYSLEAHLNLYAQGTAKLEGTLLSTKHQTHLTLGPTVGLAENLAIAFMFLNAWGPGHAPQFSGWLRPRRTWSGGGAEEPFRLALGTEELSVLWTYRLLPVEC